VIVTKLKPRNCRQCGERFMPDRLGQTIHKECVYPFALRLIEKKQEAKKKKERAEHKARKTAIKTRTEWEEECRRIVQKIARLRDRDDGCISCHLPSTWGGQWHGSHFRSHGACSVLQFNLWNIHKACSSCNRDKGGNIIEYRPRLVEKIGQERVDWLETQNGIFKPPMDYYVKFKRVMGKRLRRMEKRMEDRA
jgi:hypothetical protein